MELLAIALLLALLGALAAAFGADSRPGFRDNAEPRDSLDDA